MCITTLLFVGLIFLMITPGVQGFIAPLASPPSAHKTSRSAGGQTGAGPQQQPSAGGLSALSTGRSFRPRSPAGVWGGGCGGAGRVRSESFMLRPSGLRPLSMSVAGDDVGGAGDGSAAAQGESVEDSAAAPPPPPAARKPAEPVGAAGAMEDDILLELVGQDYGMMALLRNDKFKGLIVLLRNLPPEDWVTEVAKAYPDDDEVRGMMGQVGKLMRMIDYYQTKKPRK
ncbi:unnamed protein product [Scytosiphon promiscuus]